MMIPVPPLLAALHRELGIPPGYADERRLTPQPEASATELVDIGRNPEGRTVLLARPAAAAWFELQATAVHDGIQLVPISGFRSVARQAEIIRGKIAAGHSPAEILRTVAAPGFSEHHTGCALDIGTGEHIELDEDFALTAAFSWLEHNASRGGFRLSFPRDNPHGIAYEPWHWRWWKTANERE